MFNVCWYIHAFFFSISKYIFNIKYLTQSKATVFPVVMHTCELDQKEGSVSKN
jgi:hypothetical protein